jgi:hypothetical protein
MTFACASGFKEEQPTTFACDSGFKEERPGSLIPARAAVTAVTPAQMPAARS